MGENVSTQIWLFFSLCHSSYYQYDEFFNRQCVSSLSFDGAHSIDTFYLYTRTRQLRNIPLLYIFLQLQVSRLSFCKNTDPYFSHLNQ